MLMPWMTCAAVLALVAGLGLIWAMSAGSPAPVVALQPDAPSLTSTGLSADGTAGVGQAAGSGLAIEVPGVVGKSVQIAEALITAAGLTVQTRVSDVDGFGGAPDGVLVQSPISGAKVQSGSVVTLTYQPQIGLSPSGRRFVVVVDAGHQASPDLLLEPIGPGSSALKAKVSAGATGVSSGERESVAALQIALRVRDALEAFGVDVVMIRTSDDVNISNSQRARQGNKARADLVVRVHQSSSTDGSLEGVTSFYPAGNAWATPIEARSKAAATLLEDALVKMTGARRRDVTGRGDLSGFNYSTVPVVMVECGYLSNREEDARMATPKYRTTLGNGITAGVIAYLRSL